MITFVFCTCACERLQAQIDNQNGDIQKKDIEIKELKEIYNELRGKYNECAKPEMVQR